MKGPEAYARAALDGECEKLRSTSDNRNVALRNAAFAVGTVLHGGLLFDEALAELVASSQLERSEAEYTARKGLSDGQHKPRAIPEDYQPSRRRGGRRKRATVAPPKPRALPKPTTDATELAAEVWRVVATDATWTPEAERWCKGRGLTPAAARALGCVDVRPVLDELVAVLRAASPEAKRDGGWYAADGRPFYPLAALIQGRIEFAGLWVPQWLPGHDAPSKWRHRLYKPVAFNGDGDPIKSWSMFGATYPYGLRIADAEWYADPCQAETVIVCEGEPDTIAVIGALGPWAGVVGLPNVSAFAHGDAIRAPADWLDELVAARNIIVCTHRKGSDDSKPKAVAQAIRDRLTRAGRDDGVVKVRTLPFDEDPDGNDLARLASNKGRLSALHDKFGWLEAEARKAAETRHDDNGDWK